MNVMLEIMKIRKDFNLSGVSLGIIRKKSKQRTHEIMADMLKKLALEEIKAHGRVDNPYLPCDRQNIDELDNLTVREAMELEGIFPKAPKLERKVPKEFIRKIEY